MPSKKALWTGGGTFLVWLGALITRGLLLPSGAVDIIVLAGLCALGVAGLGRFGILVALDAYLRFTPTDDTQPSRRYVRWVTLVNGGLSAGFIAVAAWDVWFEPPREVLGLTCLALYLLLTWAVVLLVAVTRKTPLKRGTELIRDLDTIKKWEGLIEIGQPHPIYKFIGAVWGRTTPKEQMSILVVWMGLVAATLAITTVVAAAGAPLAPFAQQANDENKKASTTTPAAPVPPPVLPARADRPAGGGATPEDDNCPHGVRPGFPAPDPFGEALHSLWYGNDDRDGDGASAAGCAEWARRVNAATDFYIVRGLCGSQLRSMGVAMPNTSPVLLYQQAAVFALELIMQQQFIGASMRITLGPGDAYLIDTPDGTYVLIRSATSGGQVRKSRPNRRACAPQQDRNVEYVVVPPGLSALWIAAVRHELGWTWPISDVSNTSGAGKSNFSFQRGGEGGGDIIAHASCTSPTECTLHFGGRTTKTQDDDRFVTQDQLGEAFGG